MSRFFFGGGDIFPIFYLILIKGGLHVCLIQKYKLKTTVVEGGGEGGVELFTTIKPLLN